MSRPQRYIRVHAPGGRVLHFPEEMPPGEIQAAMDRLFAGTAAARRESEPIPPQPTRIPRIGEIAAPKPPPYSQPLGLPGTEAFNDPNSVFGQLADIGRPVMEAIYGTPEYETVDLGPGPRSPGFPRYGTRLKMQFAPDVGGLKLLGGVGRIVYHGSPHVFDKFELEKLGTGTGGQMQGHGLYFADQPGTAKYYQEVTSREQGLRLLAPSKEVKETLLSRVREALRSYNMEEWVTTRLRPGDPHYDAEETKRLLGLIDAEQRIRFRGDEMLDADVEYLRYIQDELGVRTDDLYVPPPKGAFYHVDLPDEQIDKMLDWDALLSEQSPEVQQAFQSIMRHPDAWWREAPYYDEWPTLRAEPSYESPGESIQDLTGEQAYKLLAEQLGRNRTIGKGELRWGPVRVPDDRAASEYLLRRGVPGVKYFDQGSRAARQGTRNYVVFDPEVLGEVARREKFDPVLARQMDERAKAAKKTGVALGAGAAFGAAGVLGPTGQRAEEPPPTAAPGIAARQGLFRQNRNMFGAAGRLGGPPPPGPPPPSGPPQKQKALIERMLEGLPPEEPVKPPPDYSDPDHAWLTGAEVIRPRTFEDKLRDARETIGRTAAALLDLDYDEMLEQERRGVRLGMIPFTPGAGKLKPPILKAQAAEQTAKQAARRAAARAKKLAEARRELDKTIVNLEKKFGPREQFAERYPQTARNPSFEWKWDKKKNKGKGGWYKAKRLTPEARAVERVRKAGQKVIDLGGYEPVFDVAERYYADPKRYPLTHETLTEVLPVVSTKGGRDAAKKYAKQAALPGVEGRVRRAYARAAGDPLAHHWYKMGQLEDAYILELGAEEGTKAFRKNFAEAMAATTGGADPKSNLMMAHYGNWLAEKGLKIPSASYKYPFPVGGRYSGTNMKMYNNFINLGEQLGMDQPKRHNFAANLLGHLQMLTIDEQMWKKLIRPGSKAGAPPGPSYGIFEEALFRTLEDIAPGFASSAQGVVWFGAKRMKGKPMIQVFNEMIERGSIITGKTPKEVLRGFIRKTMPMYGVAGAVGLGAAGSAEGDHRQVPPPGPPPRGREQ